MSHKRHQPQLRGKHLAAWLLLGWVSLTACQPGYHEPSSPARGDMEKEITTFLTTGMDDSLSAAWAQNDSESSDSRPQDSSALAHTADLAYHTWQDQKDRPQSTSQAVAILKEANELHRGKVGFGGGYAPNFHAFQYLKFRSSLDELYPLLAHDTPSVRRAAYEAILFVDCSQQDSAFALLQGKKDKYLEWSGCIGMWKTVDGLFPAFKPIAI